MKGSLAGMVQRTAKILLVEGKRNDRTSFYGGLSAKGHQVKSVLSGSAGTKLLHEFMPDIIIIDAASLRSSGKRIAATLKEKAPRIPMLLLLEAGGDMGSDTGAEVVLFQPFTLQKLLNRIKPFLPQEPKNGLTAGPIVLDLETRSVRCNDHQASLTPRLVSLLKALMDLPGQVISRDLLFSHVWETEYFGDTRTLDVHISWLRHAIEDDPRHPRYIKTVRGKGYRLDI
jgi:DNA-binding response OmpR family regulator